MLTWNRLGGPNFCSQLMVAILKLARGQLTYYAIYQLKLLYDVLSSEYLINMGP